MNKTGVRTRYRELRDKIPENLRENYSSRICRLLVSSVEFEKADAVFVYNSFGSEVSTKGIIEHSLSVGKTTCLPQVVGKEMKFLRINKKSRFEESRFGIKEPVSGTLCYPKDYQYPLVIMPGLCFDREFQRIGYGGGYYDRFLKEFDQKHVYTMALAFECQISEELLPFECFDIKPDCIVTQEGIRYRRKRNGNL